MTKAERIRELYAKGLSTREIADTVGCLTSYVRVCARQRAESGTSKIDARYLKKRFGTSNITEARRRRHAEAYTYDWVREGQKKANQKYRAKQLIGAE